MIISNSENCFLNNFSILGAAKIEKNIKTDPKLVHFQIIRIKILEILNCFSTESNQ